MKPRIIKETITKDSPKYTVFALIKFGEEKHVRELQEKGKIFCRPIQEFRKDEDDHSSDSYEGASKVEALMPGSPLILELPTGEIVNLKIKEGTHKTDWEFIFGNICSFYSVSALNFAGGTKALIDERMKKFGTHAILIKDAGEFLRRVKVAAKEQGLKVYTTLVEYYNPLSYCGNITLFQKRDMYAYQHELRVYVERDTLERFSFDVGSIEDISEVFTSKVMCEFQFNARYNTTLALPL